MELYEVPIGNNNEGEGALFFFLLASAREENNQAAKHMVQAQTETQTTAQLENFKLYVA